MIRKPPKRLAGWGRGRRSLAGQLMDVRACSELIGGTEDQIRSRAAHGLLPYRKWAGRVVFLRPEIMEFLEALPGVSLADARANAAARRGE